MGDTARPALTVPMAQLLKDAIDARLYDLHTCMPGTVDSYDPQTGLASIVPTLKRKYVGSDPVNLPVIKNVPVLMPRAAGGDAYVSLPLQQGDLVTLVFSERSLDIWKSSDGTQQLDPKDPRKHHLSDAYAFPGGYPKLAAPMAKGSATDLVVVNKAASATLKASGDVVLDNGTATITAAASGDVKVAAGPTLTLELTPAGKVKITGAAGELVAALVQLFTDVQTGLTTTMLGPEPLVMPTFTADLAVLQSFKG